MSAATAKSLQSCPTLYNPRDGSPPGSPAPGILQARTLEWAAISFSNAWKWKWNPHYNCFMLSNHSCLEVFMNISISTLSVLFYPFPGMKDSLVSLSTLKVSSGKSHISILCTQLFASPPRSSVHQITQTRILEWVATSSSKGSSWPRDQTHVSCLAGRFFTTKLLEKP